MRDTEEKKYYYDQSKHYATLFGWVASFTLFLLLSIYWTGIGQRSLGDTVAFFLFIIILSLFFQLLTGVKSIINGSRVWGGNKKVFYWVIPIALLLLIYTLLILGIVFQAVLL